MKTSVFQDTKEFSKKFDLLPDIKKPHITKHINERIAHLQEELDETIKAAAENDLEEVIDGLLDLIYIASGTLNMCNINSQWHWDEIHKVNMTKIRGISEKRKHEVDVIKPEGFKPPNHKRILKWYKHQSCTLNN